MGKAGYKEWYLFAVYTSSYFFFLFVKMGIFLFLFLPTDDCT